MTNNVMNRQLSLYLHIPFCAQKCNYCDFLSSAATMETQVRYVLALQKELELQSEAYREYEVDTIFIGGGTPSLLSAAHMKAIMETVHRYYRVRPDGEITIEVNPGTVDGEKLSIYQSLGINRLSIGLQSANDEELSRLGRIHTYEEFLRTYEAAREMGYGNVNIDLMSGLPGQTLESYSQTLEKVLKLQPEHLSAYSLIVEEGTPFWKLYGDGGRTGERMGNDSKEGILMPLPEEDVEREMYELTGKLLEQSGYQRYEISNYAKKGFASRHNMGYWRRHNYLGIGLGASSLIHNCRWKNTSDLVFYIEEMGNCPPEEMEHLTCQEQMEEFLFLGLRLMKGISYGEFAAYFRTPIQKVYGQQIEKGIRDGLLTEYQKKEETFLRLTDRGIDLSNVILAEFLF